MGLFKGARDLKAIVDMSAQMPKRASLLEGLGTAREAMQSVQQDQWLAANGTAGRARLLSVSDTGTTLNDHPVVELALEVSIPGRAAYRASIRQAVPRLQAGTLVPGMEMPVRVSPDDPQQVAIDWRSQATATQDAMVSGQAAASSATARYHQDPAARLERLEALRQRGLLTDAEFGAQKARILGEL